MDSILRDIQREKQKMQADIENLHRHHEKLDNYIQQYITQAVIEWARLVLDHSKALLLIVETTPIISSDGYINGEHEPIRFTALSLDSEQIILDQLIYPTHSHDVRGYEHHGLLRPDLIDKPKIDEAWQIIREALEDKHLIIFGADWARNALRTVLQKNILDYAFCLHNKTKEYYGEFYDLSLERVLSYQGINKTRDELRDSQERILMLAQVIQNLDAGMPRQSQASDDTEELDVHPF